MGQQHRFARGNNGGGRPSKGPRHPRMVRFPLPLNAAIEQAAEAAGYTNVNDFVVDVMSRAQENGLFSMTAPGSKQMELPASA
jgi:hypothetical protein